MKKIRVNQRTLLCVRLVYKKREGEITIKIKKILLGNTGIVLLFFIGMNK